MMKLLTAIAATAILLLAGLYGPPRADANPDPVPVPWYDEPALCGSPVALEGRSCIPDSPGLRVKFVEGFTCHEGLSQARIQGIVYDGYSYDASIIHNGIEKVSPWFKFCVKDQVSKLCPDGTTLIDSVCRLNADLVPAAVPLPVVPAPKLAFTGVSSDVLAFAGSGLIAFGFGVLGLRRRIDQ